MLRKSRYLYLLLLFLRASFIHAQPVDPVITIHKPDETTQIISQIEILEDVHHSYTIDNVANSKDFTIWKNGTPNLGVTSSAYWIRLTIKNETGLTPLILRLSYPGLDSVNYYEANDKNIYKTISTGLSAPFSQRQYQSADYLFPVNLAPHQQEQVYLRVCNSGTILLPLTIGPEATIFDSDKYKDVFWGMYIGLMLSMLLYNCFVYITTKDKSYLYYIVYVLAVVITQATLSGYTFQFLWPDNAWIANFSGQIMPGLPNTVYSWPRCLLG
jgi:hypothetical protein